MMSAKAATFGGAETTDPSPANLECWLDCWARPPVLG